MKKDSCAFLVALIVMCAGAHCFQMNYVPDGNTALAQLQLRTTDVYVYLFKYKGEQVNKHYHSVVNAQMEKKKGNVFFTEVDLENAKFASLVKGISADKIKASEPEDRNPIVFFMKAGDGKYYHGPLALEKFTEDFAKVGN